MMVLLQRLWIAAASGLMLAFSLGVSTGFASGPETGAEAGILQAIQEQFGLSEDEAITRLAQEARANGIHPGLKQFLGNAYAGAWFDSEQLQLFVAITDVDMQGTTQVLWTGPGTPAGDSFFGSCTPGAGVTVSVTVSNDFGSDARQSSFTCPSNEIP